MEIKCKICGCVITTKNSGIFTRSHLKKVHDITACDYYINYILKYTPLCNNESCTNIPRFISLDKGFKKYCSVACKNKSVIERNKIKQTNIERYGVSVASKSNKVKSKMIANNIAKYGVKSTLSLKSVQDKIKLTNVKKYGSEHPMQCDDIKHKVKNTNIKRYGNITPLLNSDIIKKGNVTKIKKYGTLTPQSTNEVKDKITATNMKRYGVPHPMQNKEVKLKNQRTVYNKFNASNVFTLDSVKDKIAVTNMKRYGVSYPMQNKEVQLKQQNTLKLNYGVTFPLQSNKIKSKCQHNNILKYGVDTPLKLTSIQEYMQTQHKISYWPTMINRLNEKHIIPQFNIDMYINSSEFKYKCTLCNKTITSLLTNPQKINCSCTRFRSKYEIEIYKWLESITSHKIDNNNIFYDKTNKIRHELDIYIPSKNLGIEFHGLYWHSSIHKHKLYHQSKLEFFKQRNIKLIQIFENEWVYKQEIVKSIIQNKLGNNTRIYGRKTGICELTVNEYKQFLIANHIQGYTQSKIKIGLRYDNELVAVLGISKNRYSSESKYELTRMAFKKYHTVVGGFNKMLQYAMNKYELDSLITYCDLRYFDATGYKQIGFDFINNTNPNYYYFKRNTLTLHSRMAYQKHKLPKKLLNFDKNKTEYENMLNNNYLRIFDAGNSKLIYTKRSY